MIEQIIATTTTFERKDGFRRGFKSTEESSEKW